MNFIAQNIVLDYYPFGSAIPGRSFSPKNYRFGYQGSEKDFDVSEDNYTTHFRMSDTRLGRWFSLDPVFQPYQNPYNSMDNNPIWFNDVLGNVVDGDKKGMENYSKYRKEVNDRIDVINKKINDVEKGSKEFDKLTTQLKAYNDINKELDVLESDQDNVYYLNSDAYKDNTGAKADGQIYDGGEITYKDKQMRKINVDLRSDGFFMSTMAHELKHTFQYYEGRLVLIAGTKKGFNAQNFEKEAFERGDRFLGNTLYNNNRFNLNYSYKGDAHKTGPYKTMLTNRDKWIFPEYQKTEEKRDKYINYFRSKGYVFNIPKKKFIFNCLA